MATTTLEMMHTLPEGIRNHIHRFLSTPSADAFREKATEYKEFQDWLVSMGHQQLESQINTFYIYHFSEARLNMAMRETARIREAYGIELTIPERSLRPKLWRMYKRAQGNLFPFDWETEDDADFSDDGGKQPFLRRRSTPTSRNTSTAHSTQRSSGSPRRFPSGRPVSSHMPLLGT